MGYTRGTSQARRQDLLEELDRITGILRAQNVEKVILFGSLARGEVSSSSDIDLIVVMNTTKRFLDRLHEIYAEVQPRKGLDVLVYTPDEFELLSKDRAFVRRAVAEGKVLYEKET